MLLVREVFHCKPGKVRPMVEKFLTMAKLNERAGLPKFRVMTDLCGERYWTVVAEFEVANLQALEDMMAGKGISEELNKEYEKAMEGYHDLMLQGQRQIFKLEG